MQWKKMDAALKSGFIKPSAGVWLSLPKTLCNFWLLQHLFTLFYQFDRSFLWLLVRPQKAQLPLWRIQFHFLITALLALHSCQGLYGAEGRDPKPLVCVIINQKASGITLTSSVLLQLDPFEQNTLGLFPISTTQYLIIQQCSVSIPLIWNPIFMTIVPVNMQEK